MKRAARLLLPALLLAALTGCATARIPEFQAFADAGTAYTQAVTGLITEVGNAAVDANSVKLLENRSLAQVPLSAFEQQDQEMRDYLTELSHIQVQTTLLGNYFQALADLATSSAPESFATEVESVATTLTGVTQEVTGTEIAQSAEIASAAGSVGGLVVKEIQGKELERELNARKDTIARILQIQEALLKVLRLNLTSVINQLSTAQLTQIESKLEQNDAALQQGIQSLQTSLGDLTAAPSWASAINGVIGTIGQIIPLV